MLRPSRHVAIMVVTSVLTLEALLQAAGPQPRPSNTSLTPAPIIQVSTYALHTYDLDELVVQLADADTEHFLQVLPRVEVSECDLPGLDFDDPSVPCGPSPVGSPADWAPVAADAIIMGAARSTAAALEVQDGLEALERRLNDSMRQQLSSSNIRLELAATTLHLESTHRHARVL